MGRPDDRALTESLLAPVLEPTRKGFVVLLVALLGGVTFWLISLGTTLLVGIGVWGNNIPVDWAFDITNFVWWIGIGHAGTLISRHPLPLPAEVAHLRSTASRRR